LERREPRQDPDGRGAAHPALGRRLPLRAHLRADRGGTGPEVRSRLVLALLAVLPVLALLPALSDGRLVSPGDGAFLHYPMRAAAWSALRHGELPAWNPAVFSGAPLLAAYRAGALYPPMLLLAQLPAFDAFQLLVTGSLCAACVLTFFYLRRLGANLVGAYAAGVAFGLGPYLVGHLDDTATIVAAPLL